MVPDILELLELSSYLLNAYVDESTFLNGEYSNDATRICHVMLTRVDYKYSNEGGVYKQERTLQHKTLWCLI
jgi:hypothetical protein